MGVSAVQAGTCITVAFRQCAAVRSRVRSARTKADRALRNATMHIHYPCAQSKISTLRVVRSARRSEVQVELPVKLLRETRLLPIEWSGRYFRRIIYRVDLYGLLFFCLIN